jgi:esterase/lipase superfamily enzyme
VHVEERSWSSDALGQDMALKVYGHAGRPVVAFPSQDGRYWDFESWGMVEACAGFIDEGRARIISVDGIDSQSWTNQAISPADRARRHDDYDRYLAAELVPFVRDLTGWERSWATGASMGAYHAANVVFHHPDAFDGLIAMSGLDDPWYLDRLRAAKLAFVVGRGAWEDDMLADTRAMCDVLAAKGIPAIVDEWGDDVNHDWPWWRKMLPHYLDRLGV